MERAERSAPRLCFQVNLSPTESDRIIELELGRTDVGKVMLEADLLLKKTAARLLHPDHPLGARFWDDLYGWVGAKGVKMCHSFRQWIVPGKVELQLQMQQPQQPDDGEGGGGGGGVGGGRGGGNHPHDGEGARPTSLLHILRAPLLVKQEAEYAAGGGGLAPIARDAEVGGTFRL